MGQNDERNANGALLTPPYDKLYNATPENPVFVKCDVLDYEGANAPYMVDTVLAVTNCKNIADDMDPDDVRPYLQGAVIEPGENVMRSDFRPLVKNDTLIVDAGQDLDFREMLEPTSDLKKSYEDYVNKRQNAPYVVTGILYSENPSYQSWDKQGEFPFYDELPATQATWLVEKGTELSSGGKVESVSDVRLWVLENHPAYIQGFSAAEKDIPSGAFMITPAPCGEYPEGMYEDYAARRKYAEDLASVYGIEIGKETAQDVLVRMRSNRPLPKTPDSPDNEPQSGFDFS